MTLFAVRVLATGFLGFLLCLYPSATNANWGLEVGRASDVDVANLNFDWLAVKKATETLRVSVTRELRPERQKQILGVASGESLSSGELFRRTLTWWEDHVLAPAAELVTNPAASCAEAQEVVAIFLSMERQRQLFGLAQELGDNSADGLAAAAEDARLTAIRERVIEAAQTRCRNEAVDECFATGRSQQIFDLASSVGRQSAFLGGSEDVLQDWAVAALQECAIYDLKFVSNGGFTPRNGISYERVVTGVIPITFHLGPTGFRDPQTGFYGQSNEAFIDSGNPWLVSIKCSVETQNPRKPSVECLPLVEDPERTQFQEKSTSSFAQISAMELRHKEFVLRTNGVTTEQSGEDRLDLHFGPSHLITNARVNGKDIPLEVNVTVYSVYLSRKFMFQTTQRGAYPVLFEWKDSAKSNIGLSGPVFDRTDFQLLHRPKLATVEREPDPRRMPIRPK